MSLSHSITTGALWLHHTHTAENADTSDHTITLVDRTISTADPNASRDDAPPEPPPSARRSGESSPSRKGTTGGLREEIARRRHSKSRGKRDVNGEPGNISAQDEPPEGRSGNDPGHRQRIRDKILWRRKKSKPLKDRGKFVTDVLYENQRGMFLFGIPLYSSNSLLNFDPPAWQTGELKESPVNITNAQVPDPSWMWTMKTWYVDMSRDVDEQGWEYSFSFKPILNPFFKSGFAWHGNHPWFHSLVRRRKWIRKRAKISSRTNLEKNSGSHMLNADYFTIHDNRDRSRGSSAERSTNKRSSFGGRHTVSGDEGEDEEINDIVALTKTFKNTTLDRKKLEAMRNFLEHGGEDLHYLSQYMPDLMGMFFYQTSRQQLLVELQDFLESLLETKNRHGDQGNAEDEKSKRKSDNIQEAVAAALAHVKDLEYWSDRKKIEKLKSPVETEFNDEIHDLDGAGSIKSSLQRPETEGDDFHSVTIENEIKGIPEEAAIDVEPRIQFEEEDIEERPDDRGKISASEENGNTGT